MAFSLNTQKHTNRYSPYSLAPQLPSQCSSSPSLSVLGPPSRASLPPHLLPQSSRYFVAPDLVLLLHLSPGPPTPSALHTEGATPGQPAVAEVPRSRPSTPQRALSGPRSCWRRKVGCHRAKALRRPGQAGRRPGRSQRRLTPSPKAARSPRARTPRRAQASPAGAPNARVRVGDGGGGPTSETRARLPARAAPASPAAPRNTLSTHGGDRRRRSPGRARAGTPATPGEVTSSQRRLRARHSRPRSRAPEVPPLAKLPCAPHWFLDLLNHRRRWRLVEAQWRVRPLARGRPASPPGLSPQPRHRAALCLAPSRGAV